MFLDERGVSFTPPVRRTWAPRGRTPILRHRQRNWARLSMAAMCCYHPDGRRARLAFHVQPGSYNDQLLIGVLGQLRRFLGDQKATLLWDGLRSHWSRPMRAFIARQRGWLVVERLPAYAPELNPVEGVWANLKGQELANYAADTLDDLTPSTPAAASPASAADGGCCSPSSTAPAFQYDQQSPYSEKILRRRFRTGSGAPGWTRCGAWPGSASFTAPWKRRWPFGGSCDAGRMIRCAGRPPTPGRSTQPTTGWGPWRVRSGFGGCGLDRGRYDGRLQPGT